MDLMLKGKRVLITGASQGIGEGLAEVFAEEGCDLHLVARQVERMQALATRNRPATGFTKTSCNAIRKPKTITYCCACT